MQAIRVSSGLESLIDPKVAATPEGVVRAEPP